MGDKLKKVVVRWAHQRPGMYFWIGGKWHHRQSLKMWIQHSYGELAEQGREQKTQQPEMSEQWTSNI